VNDAPLYQLLWAKTSKDRTSTHPLICHMIDVAQVTAALWDHALTDSIRTQLALSMGLDHDQAGRVISFWAGLHDLGKACPAFQRQYRPRAETLASAGLPFPPAIMCEPCYHGAVSALVLERALSDTGGLAGRPARRIARAVGGHHGSWPLPAEIQALKAAQIGGEQWADARRDLLDALHNLVMPPSVAGLGETRETENALLALLAGLISAADWVGSMEFYFPYVCAPVNLPEYAAQSSDRAKYALRMLGWSGWQPPDHPVAFSALFHFEPRLAQEAAIALAEQITCPALVIIEAPTGIGKTEAALYLADHWARVCQQRGLYVAMPTMATSNQMYGRVKKFLSERYPEGLLNLQLLHGHAAWREDVRVLRMETTEELEEKESNLAAMAWFLPRKRSLLAPFGVGTIDQALLSVLQTRHFFVRLFGLSHKTIIFDEVHAYDTYMSTLLQHSLSWLKAIGASVVLLSATLPRETRWQLLQAYTGASEVPLPDVPYPAITWAMEGRVEVAPLAAESGRALRINWVAREPEGIISQLREGLQDGGCAAVICNTVRRAQEMYRALKNADFVLPENLILFHARFPLAWRDKIEESVLRRFGKDGTHADRERAIVVATQVIEQSLDLDFDLMISDLAPIDLVLQRAGRLHRHAEHQRPPRLAGEPRLLLASPELHAGAPVFGRDAIYEPYVLLRSYLALRGRERLTLPEETAALIETVYGDESLTPGLTPALASTLRDFKQKMQRHEEGDVFKARQKLIPPPQSDDLLGRRSLALREDSPELHEAFQALTRLTPPSVSFVCLHRTAQGLATEPNGKRVFDPNEPPDSDTTRELAQYSISVSDYRLVHYFSSQPSPAGWREHPLLRNYHVLVFNEGVCCLDAISCRLHLSREIGLEIGEEAE